MISERLEKLILQGVATYRTFTHAATGKSQLQVRNDRFIVITDFWVYDWLDADLIGNAATLQAALQRAVKQISIYSDDSFNRFIHRSTAIYSSEPAGANATLVPNKVTHYQVYLPHKSNVTIEILNVPDPATWTAIVTENTTERAQAYKRPLGFGKLGLTPTLPTQSRVQFTATEETRPDPITASPSAGYTFSAEGFQVAAVPSNNQNTPTGDLRGLQYPIINIGYVEIFETPENVQGGN